MMRLVPNHASKIERASTVRFTFAGALVEGRVGESLISALIRADKLALGITPNNRSARGAFCCMGLCQACAVQIDGQTVEACRVTVTEGLVVDRVT